MDVAAVDRRVAVTVAAGVSGTGAIVAKGGLMCPGSVEVWSWVKLGRLTEG
jgi:hypothetical protein